MSRPADPAARARPSLADVTVVVPARNAEALLHMKEEMGLKISFE